MKLAYIKTNTSQDRCIPWSICSVFSDTFKFTESAVLWSQSHPNLKLLLSTSWSWGICGRAAIRQIVYIQIQSAKSHRPIWCDVSSFLHHEGFISERMLSVDICCQPLNLLKDPQWHMQLSYRNNLVWRLLSIADENLGWLSHFIEPGTYGANSAPSWVFIYSRMNTNSLFLLKKVNIALHFRTLM